jgi:transcriptional regulator with XRE-family HTH domain
MDKRDLATLFRERVGLLVQRKGASQGAFAGEVGLDRSAFSQMMSADGARLPRAETLRQIAEANAVSVDWLLGLSHDAEVGPVVSSRIAIEDEHDAQGVSPLERWHREAEGYKIRYVPASLPDLLLHTSLQEVDRDSRSPSAQRQISEAQLDYSRLPETDMEVCMPLQRITALTAGTDVWADLDASRRRVELEHMAKLVGELYPRFRMFLYDGRVTFSGAYTVFGPIRAVIYLGRSYVVITAVEHVRALARHFDDLIKVAVVAPDRVERYLRKAARDVA